MNIYCHNAVKPNVSQNKTKVETTKKPPERAAGLERVKRMKALAYVLGFIVGVILIVLLKVGLLLCRQ